jgi:hypothetical protein
MAAQGTGSLSDLIPEELACLGINPDAIQAAFAAPPAANAPATENCLGVQAELAYPYANDWLLSMAKSADGTARLLYVNNNTDELWAHVPLSCTEWAPQTVLVSQVSHNLVEVDTVENKIATVINPFVGGSDYLITFEASADPLSGSWKQFYYNSTPLRISLAGSQEQENVVVSVQQYYVGLGYGHRVFHATNDGCSFADDECIASPPPDDSYAPYLVLASRTPDVSGTKVLMDIGNTFRQMTCPSADVPCSAGWQQSMSFNRGIYPIKLGAAGQGFEVFAHYQTLNIVVGSSIPYTWPLADSIWGVAVDEANFVYVAEAKDGNVKPGYIFMRHFDPVYGWGEVITATSAIDGSEIHLPQQAGWNMKVIRLGDGTCQVLHGSRTYLINCPEPPAQPNQPPQLNDLILSSPEDTPVSGQLTAIDDGGVVTFTVSTMPTNGSANLIQTDGLMATVTYTPALNFHGQDNFEVLVTDNEGLTATATVNITLTPVNDAPIAVDDFASTPYTDTVIVSVLENDSDVDGDNLNVEAVGQPTHGAVSTNGQQVAYTPEAGFVGQVVFNYTIGDGNGGTANADVNVTVTDGQQPINHLPVITTATFTVPVDKAVSSVIGQVNASDPDGDMLSFAITGGNDDGYFVINAATGQLSVAKALAVGTYPLTVEVTDGHGGSATAVVTIEVQEVVTDPPPEPAFKIFLPTVLK